MYIAHTSIYTYKNRYICKHMYVCIYCILRIIKCPFLKPRVHIHGPPVPSNNKKILT